MDKRRDRDGHAQPRRARRIKHERSAGGLVLRRAQDGYDGLVIGRANPRIWSLPKGHVEPTETIEEAAVREVQEETGIAGSIIDKLSDIRYWFYSNKAKHSKVVHFFLMRYVGGSPSPQAGEVDEAVWVPLNEMTGVLTHLNERRLVGLAQAIIEAKPPVDLDARPS
jgi:8-oxo-dGTP pyrophosphatase MutT (NUDIX family)